MSVQRYIPVVRDEDWRNPIGQVTKYNPRTGKVTLEITDPAVLELLAGRVAVSLTIREVPEHRKEGDA